MSTDVGNDRRDPDAEGHRLRSVTERILKHRSEFSPGLALEVVACKLEEVENWLVTILSPEHKVIIGIAALAHVELEVSEVGGDVGDELLGIGHELLDLGWVALFKLLLPHWHELLSPRHEAGLLEVKWLKVEVLDDVNDLVLGLRVLLVSQLVDVTGLENKGASLLVLLGRVSIADHLVVVDRGLVEPHVRSEVTRPTMVRTIGTQYTCTFTKSPWQGESKKICMNNIIQVLSQSVTVLGT